jgi:hypothetical protein
MENYFDELDKFMFFFIWWRGKTNLLAKRNDTKCIICKGAEAWKEY